MSLTRDCICPMVLTRGRYYLDPFVLSYFNFLYLETHLLHAPYASRITRC